MGKRLSALVLISLIVTAGRPSAQTVGGGIKGGMNFSTVTGEIFDASRLTKSLRLGWTCGGFLFFSISQQVSLQLEGLYSIEGFTGNTTVTFDVLQIPVLFRVGKESKGRTSPYLSPGQELGFC
jgi:hypothetical protein